MIIRFRMPVIIRSQTIIGSRRSVERKPANDCGVLIVAAK